ncbi:adenylate/guanylate cyclase domain-containing protein [Mycolicibacterium fortuitum]|uniref:adenylate/guanylate cyclase domain-containing protein n=1 Tax=Mycolicibacterium fortuitum TaxID=1766 RepID=UPI0007EBCCE7|nr:adenylate/guanylate cyclase domain-containing protein [Mycolicibacterium fortuitum]MDG5768554.1 adenylate/guanylate cyclase domain-containing protein [Mycolicibacterium fortuitum]MDG5780440.1 adenylate/guanylate cyclase domain-containing protein [Mycolicibacterium fortuitum]OBB06789.1 adenylate cyclase [Mycolicibacterium fortuitum]TPW90941.1 adenylate/guanylate cyclase domain-containing protein [Mycolicibacterium fortuitum]
MNGLSVDQFGDAVMNDYRRRRELGGRSVVASAGPTLETKALGHPAFEELEVGERRSSSLAVGFLDLTDFTGRSFWDDETEVVDLADAVLSGFVKIVSSAGGYPMGLRGDGLFMGFGPANPNVDTVMALSACAFGLQAIQDGLNPKLKAAGIEPVKARAGVDYGRLTFVRSGSRDHNEVNVIGFPANFAAKCEKKANSWEIVAGEGLQQVLSDSAMLVEHKDSPKRYQRDYEVRYYRFYDYLWRKSLPYIPSAFAQIGGHSTAQISIK